MVRVLHIDDEKKHHELTCNQILRLSNDFSFERADSLKSALKILSKKEYDCILTDEQMCTTLDENWLQKVRDKGITIPVVMESDFLEDEGLEFKDSALGDDLSVKIVFCRYDLLTFWIQKLIDRWKELLENRKKEVNVEKIKNKLTKREYEILELIAEGKSNKEIAWDLNISYRTTVNHIYNLFQKLGVNSRMEAVQFILGDKRVK